MSSEQVPVDPDGPSDHRWACYFYSPFLCGRVFSAREKYFNKINDAISIDDNFGAARNYTLFRRTEQMIAYGRTLNRKQARLVDDLKARRLPNPLLRLLVNGPYISGEGCVTVSLFRELGKVSLCVVLLALLYFALVNQLVVELPTAGVVRAVGLVLSAGVVLTSSAIFALYVSMPAIAAVIFKAKYWELTRPSSC